MRARRYILAGSNRVLHYEERKENGNTSLSLGTLSFDRSLLSSCNSTFDFEHARQLRMPPLPSSMVKSSQSLHLFSQIQLCLKSTVAEDELVEYSSCRHLMSRWRSSFAIPVSFGFR